MVQNLYSDGDCLILQLFHDCLGKLENIIKFDSFVGSLLVITVAQAEQFNLVPRKKLFLHCCTSLYKKGRIL